MADPTATESLVTSIVAGAAALGSAIYAALTRRQLSAVVGDGEPLGPRLEVLEGRMDRQEQRQTELETTTRHELSTMNTTLSDIRETVGRIDERTKAL